MTIYSFIVEMINRQCYGDKLGDEVGPTGYYYLPIYPTLPYSFEVPDGRKLTAVQISTYNSCIEVSVKLKDSDEGFKWYYVNNPAKHAGPGKVLMNTPASGTGNGVQRGLTDEEIQNIESIYVSGGGYYDPQDTHAWIRVYTAAILGEWEDIS